MTATHNSLPGYLKMGFQSLTNKVYVSAYKLTGFLAYLSMYNQRFDRQELTVKRNISNTISISDQASGIPPEQRDGIFDRYTEFRKSGKGSGLGLHIVKKLVERYEGRIWIESRLPENYKLGTTLKIELLLPDMKFS